MLLVGVIDDASPENLPPPINQDCSLQQDDHFIKFSESVAEATGIFIEIDKKKLIQSSYKFRKSHQSRKFYNFKNCFSSSNFNYI